MLLLYNLIITCLSKYSKKCLIPEGFLIWVFRLKTGSGAKLFSNSDPNRSKTTESGSATLVWTEPDKKSDGKRIKQNIKRNKNKPKERSNRTIIKTTRRTKYIFMTGNFVWTAQTILLAVQYIVLNFDTCSVLCWLIS